MLRQGTITDVPLTRAFREKILAERLPTIFEGRVPTLEEQERWHQRFEEDKNSVMFVYLIDGEVVGMLGFTSFASTPQCRHSGAFGVSVLAPYRGRGIGKALIEALVEWAGRHPEVRRLELEVLGNNPRAQALYERMGFVVEGIKKQAVRVGNSYVDSTVMARWVEMLDTVDLKTPTAP